MTLRLLSYNIRYGGVGREAALASVVRESGADIVILQEATHPGVIERVAKLSGFAHCGSRRGHSTGYLSRIPIAHHAWHHTRSARHAFLELVLEGSELRIYGLHLSAWFSKWSERRRAVELRALLDGIQQYQHGFHVIAGDFNALAPGERLHVGRMPAWIRAMVWLSGRDIARDTIQLMLNQQYIDVWRRLHPDKDGYTFPTWDPHVRLDYVFTHERYAPLIEECAVLRSLDGVDSASHHFPLLVQLRDASRSAPSPARA